MTTPSRMAMIANWLKNFLVIWAVGVGFLGAIGSAVWAVSKDDLEEYARTVLQLDQLATRGQVEALREDLHRISGEDRVVRIRQSQSYVLEPVRQGDLVRVQYLIQRTARGAKCIVEDGTPIFRDVRDIGFPGEIVTPLQQFGTEWRRARTVFRAPQELLPGRIELTVSLRYDCGGRTVFDEIDAVVYFMEPVE